jgi:plastocyanin
MTTVVIVVGLFIWLPMTASTGPVVRQINLVAKDMAFYLEGDQAPNPTIRLTAGEQVRFNILNLDYGLAHNLAIDGWSVETAYLNADESAVVYVRAQEQAGRQAYVCSPHREMMRGVIEIVASD